VAIAAAVDVVGQPLAAVDYREHRRTFPDLAHSRGSLIRTPVSGISSGKVRPFPEAHPQVLIIPLGAGFAGGWRSSNPGRWAGHGVVGWA
jgi:hypothetical protein